MVKLLVADDERVIVYFDVAATAVEVEIAIGVAHSKLPLFLKLQHQLASHIPVAEFRPRVFDVFFGIENIVVFSFVKLIK